MADAKKKNAKKKAPPELTPEQRRKLAEKQLEPPENRAGEEH